MKWKHRFCLEKEWHLFNKPFAFFSQMEASSFTMTFFGEGYNEHSGGDKNKLSVKICTQVKGPGIAILSFCIVRAYVTILFSL